MLLVANITSLEKNASPCNDNQFPTVISAPRLDVSATCIIFTFDYKTRLKFLQLILLFLWLSFATNTCDRGFAISEMLIDQVRIAKTTCGFYKNRYWTGLALSKFTMYWIFFLFFTANCIKNKFIVVEYISIGKKVRCNVTYEFQLTRLNMI